jgi:hypothetical protein
VSPSCPWPRRVGRGVAAVYTPHALITLDPGLGLARRLVYGTLERLLAPLGERIICVSGEERAHALRLGIDGRRLALVPNGLATLPPADRAAARRALRLAEADVCVGFVGRPCTTSCRSDRVPSRNSCRLNSDSRWKSLTVSRMPFRTLKSCSQPRGRVNPSFWRECLLRERT